MADMTLDELRARLHPTGDDGEWFARDELALMVEGIDTIRAELLRLAEDAAMFAHAVSLGQRYKQRAETAEAELAALKARMRPVARIENGEVRALMDPADEGKYVAVVVVEE